MPVVCCSIFPYRNIRMTAFVYLLPHAEHSRFKIGKANELLARIRQLGSEQFDLAKSRALRVDSQDDAQNLERLLHRAFAKSRLPAEFVAEQEGYSRDGATEWFDNGCLERLDQFLHENADLLGFSLVSPEELSELLRPRLRPPMLVKPKKSAGSSRMTAANRAERRIRDIAGAEAHAESLLPLLEALVEYCPGLRLNAGARGEATLVGFCDLAMEATVREYLEELFGQSYKYTTGCFRLAPSLMVCKGDSRFEFELSLAWPGRLHESTYESGARRLAALPLAIPGWSCPEKSTELELLAA